MDTKALTNELRGRANRYLELASEIEKLAEIAVPNTGRSLSAAIKRRMSIAQKRRWSQIKNKKA